jgi:quinol-cytochrome oxidoreductase complex cytochrome b subunit
MPRRSTLTALANSLFAAAVLLLFAAMYRQGSFRSPWVLVAALLLVGAIACWGAAARWGRIEDDVEPRAGSRSG